MSKQKSEPTLVQVKLRTSVARKEGARLRTYADGDVYSCTKEEAERLINNDRAEPIAPPEPKAKAKDAE